jgi:small-conductance mechanosensitive channel
MEAFLEHNFLGNPWERWVIASCLFAGILLAALGLKALLINRLRLIAPSTTSHWGNVALQLLERTRLLFVVLVALHFAVQTLSLHPKAEQATHLAFFLVLFLQVGFWANHAVTYLGYTYAERTLATDAARATTVRALIVFAQMFVWVTVTILLLDNWGVKVAPFVAGLGIGGIAIALAVQNILGDLFSSLSIVLDKPFVIGDFITVGEEMGTVEHIGLKSTRVKSLTGEQLVFSNSDLLKSRIRNFKRMQERRALLRFGLIYETDPKQLHRVRELVKNIVGSVPRTRFDRCHLRSFGQSSLDFEAAYWVNSAEFNDYADVHHEISVKLIEAFRAERLEFAYPTVLEYHKAASHEANGS